MGKQCRHTRQVGRTGRGSFCNGTAARCWQRGLAQWEAFARSRGSSAETRSVRGEGAHRVAAIQMRLGLLAEAEANYRQSLAERAALASEFPDTPKWREQLAATHDGLGILL